MNALELLSAPLNGRVLVRLADGPSRLVDLRVETGYAPQTTLRAHLRELEGVGAIVKRGRENAPGVVEYALTEAGEALLDVATALERWLGEAPDGPLDLTGDSGKAAVKAFVGGWSSTVIHSLARRPLTLSDVAGGIRTVSYPSVERRLSALRVTGQVEARAGGGKGTPYAVTDWLRQGVRPLAAAVRWEHAHLSEAGSMSRIDAETAFLLALPLLRTPSELEGSCLMAMEVKGGENCLAGAVARVERGRVTRCTPVLEQAADAWATGPPPAWTDAMTGAGRERLEIGGQQGLAGALVDSLRQPLAALVSP